MYAAPGDLSAAAPLIIELRRVRRHRGGGSAMIYMVEMDFRHPERQAEWHSWYLAHIRVLQTVPGFRASQRFQAIAPTPSPYLALHEVASPQVFESAETARAAARPRPANGARCRPTGTATCSTGSTGHQRCRPTNSSFCCAVRAMPDFRSVRRLWTRRSRGCAGPVSYAAPANAGSPSSRTPRRSSRSHAATSGCGCTGR